MADRQKQVAAREGPDGFSSFDIVDEVPIETGADCEGAIKLEDRGNAEYAWWYLVSKADQDAILTIRRSWLHEAQIRTDTQQHSLYPGEEREVFSFPRNQIPKVTFVSCRLN